MTLEKSVQILKFYAATWHRGIYFNQSIYFDQGIKFKWNLKYDFSCICNKTELQYYIVELQWLKHLWDYESMFEAGVVRANEC